MSAIAALAPVRQPPAPGYLSGNLREALFVVLGVLLLAAAVLVVSSPVVVHAGLWLVVALGALAGEYVLLTAEFVAWVQVLVYLGAVVVLLLFGAMLTRAPTARGGLDNSHRLPAALAAVAAGGGLAVLVASGFADAYVRFDDATGAQPLGIAIFRGWVWPFEVVSLLLLAALIGSLAVAGRARRHDASTAAEPAARPAAGDAG